MTPDQHDYLWDGGGEPDELVRRLEEALRPLRYERPLDAPPATGPENESHTQAQTEEE